jgi:hypothetical protein
MFRTIRRLLHFRNARSDAFLTSKAPLRTKLIAVAIARATNYAELTR